MHGGDHGSTVAVVRVAVELGLVKVVADAGIVVGVVDGGVAGVALALGAHDEARQLVGLVGVVDGAVQRREEERELDNVLAGVERRVEVALELHLVVARVGHERTHGGVAVALVQQEHLLGLAEDLEGRHRRRRLAHELGAALVEQRAVDALVVRGLGVIGEHADRERKHASSARLVVDGELAAVDLDAADELLEVNVHVAAHIDLATAELEALGALELEQRVERVNVLELVVNQAKLAHQELEAAAGITQRALDDDRRRSDTVHGQEQRAEDHEDQYESVFHGCGRGRETRDRHEREGWVTGDSCGVERRGAANNNNEERREAKREKRRAEDLHGFFQGSSTQ